MAVSFQGVSLKDAVDNLLRLKDRQVAAAIDAGACRTGFDYRAKRNAEDCFEEALSAFEVAFDQDQVGR